MEQPKEPVIIVSCSTQRDRSSGIPLPAWDRASDRSFTKPITPAQRETPSATKFKLSVAEMYRIHNRTRGANENQAFFQLPDAVRLRVYEHLLGPHDSGRPIRMNHRGHVRPAWPDGHFDSLADALEPLRAYLEDVCFALRAELLAAFFASRRLHVTFSPYVNATTSPLATGYLNRYSRLVRHLTVELDFTKLSYGPEPAAAGLATGSGIMNVGELVSRFMGARVAVAGSARDDVVTLDSLVVLCRRFYGDRPVPNIYNKTNPNAIMPYVGPEHEVVAELLTGLSGLVDSARVVGFEEAFATRMLKALYGGSPEEGGTDDVFRQHHPSDVYPLALPPGQSAYLDYGPDAGGIRLVQNMEDSSNNRSSILSGELADDDTLDTIISMDAIVSRPSSVSSSLRERFAGDGKEHTEKRKPNKLQKKNKKEEMERDRDRDRDRAGSVLSMWSQSSRS